MRFSLLRGGVYFLVFRNPKLPEFRVGKRMPGIAREFNLFCYLCNKMY